MKIILFLMLFLAFAYGAFAENVTTSNPMLIDTAGVISTTPLYISEMIWDQIGTDGDVVIIKDNASGYRKAYRQGIQGVPMTIWRYPKKINMLNVERIDSGVLEIHIE